MADASADTLAQAVSVLREAALGAYRLHPDVRNAINTLDNADLFSKIDEQVWYEPVPVPADPVDCHPGNRCASCR